MLSLTGSGDISEDRPLYLATSEFGVNLHKQLTDGYYGNVVFSPLSVYTALSMTLLGADGITKNELEVPIILCFLPGYFLLSLSFFTSSKVMC